MTRKYVNNESWFGLHLCTCHENHNSGLGPCGIGFIPVFDGFRPPFNLRLASVQKQSGRLAGKPTGARNLTVVALGAQPSGSPTFGTVTTYDPSGARTHVAPGNFFASSSPCSSAIVIQDRMLLVERCKTAGGASQERRFRYR